MKRINRKNGYTKCRIVQRDYVDGRVSFVIQQKHFIFRWHWIDAWINSSSGASCLNTFVTLEEAKNNLCYFDGSSHKDKVII